MRPSLLAAALLFATPVLAQPRVAVLGAVSPDSWNADVQTKIAGTGLFSVVDAYNVRSALPTLTTLQTYDAVLAFTDYGAAFGFGDLLADYYDGGGRVVTAVFGSTNGIHIDGRWQTGGYSLFGVGGQNQGTTLTLGAYDATSPLMAGVTTFNGGSSSYRGSAAPVAGATVVAAWSNGEPLVVTGTVGGRARVDLNFYPPSSDVRGDFWSSSTDGDRLMANALLYTGASVTATPEPATLALMTGGLGVLMVGVRRRRRTAAE